MNLTSRIQTGLKKPTELAKLARRRVQWQSMGEKNHQNNFLTNLYINWALCDFVIKIYEFFAELSLLFFGNISQI